MRFDFCIYFVNKEITIKLITDNFQMLKNNFIVVPQMSINYITKESSDAAGI